MLFLFPVTPKTETPPSPSHAKYANELFHKPESKKFPGLVENKLFVGSGEDVSYLMEYLNDLKNHKN